MGQAFLNDETNKIELNNFIQKAVAMYQNLFGTNKFCVTNVLTNLVTDNGKKVIYTPNSSVLKKADNCIACHINDLIENSFSKISVKTCNTENSFSKVSVKTRDTDVLVMVLELMEYFLDSILELKL